MIKIGELPLSRREHYITLHNNNKKYLKNLDSGIFRNSNVKIIDKYDDNLLIEYSLNEDDALTTFRYIRVKDSSKGDFTFLSVPNTVNFCKEAIAWTFNLKTEDFELLFET